MWTEPHPDGGALLHLKVVPGASRSRVVGVHGERLRVQIAAPPEKGRANKELCALLARSLGVRRSDVTVVRGASSPRKTVHVGGVEPARVAELLGA